MSNMAFYNCDSVHSCIILAMALVFAISLEACPGSILVSIRHCYLVQWGFWYILEGFWGMWCTALCSSVPFHTEGQSEASMHANTSTGTYLVSERPFKNPSWQSALHPSSEISTSLWSRISRC